jgi:hypothetical protein
MRKQSVVCAWTILWNATQMIETEVIFTQHASSACSSLLEVVQPSPKLKKP